MQNSKRKAKHILLTELGESVKKWFSSPKNLKRRKFVSSSSATPLGALLARTSRQLLKIKWTFIIYALWFSNGQKANCGCPQPTCPVAASLPLPLPLSLSLSPLLSCCLLVGPNICSSERFPLDFYERFLTISILPSQYLHIASQWVLHWATARTTCRAHSLLDVQLTKYKSHIGFSMLA